MKVLNHSVVSNSAIPWIIARQPPLFMTFPRQEYWRGKKKREREHCGKKKRILELVAISFSRGSP